MRVFWKFLQLYLLLFLVCLTESLYAAPRYYFKQISLENGLSQSSVKCVLVDERGVMWIGTRFGLNRFDREKITVYQEERENPHSLPYNDIVFLEEDAEGNIWVGTCCGLAYFDRGTFRNLLLSLLPVIFIFLEWKGWLGYGPGYDIHEEEDFSVSMINLALDGLPIHPDGISGEQAISIPWDYVSLGRGINQGRISIWRSRLI